MGKLFLWLLGFAVLWSVNPMHAQDLEASKALLPDQKIHDFGAIRECDGKVKHTFRLANKSKEPVVICDVSAWCGCTTVDYSRKPIAPGAVAEVTVTFDPNHRSGTFSKEVAILSKQGTDAPMRYTRLWVKGDITPYLHPVTEDHPYAFGGGLYMNLQVLAFPPVKGNEEFSIELLVANDTPRPITVAFAADSEVRGLEFPQTIRLDSLERTAIPVRYRAPRTYYSNREVVFTPTVNGRKVKSLRATLAGNKYFWED